MSMTVAKIRGIRIKIHYTFIIIFVMVAWSLSAYLVPTLIPGLGFAVNLYMAITGAAVLFSSVILHELGYSIMAF